MGTFPVSGGLSDALKLVKMVYLPCLPLVVPPHRDQGKAASGCQGQGRLGGWICLLLPQVLPVLRLCSGGSTVQF